jgi:hypothetical protein
MMINKIRYTKRLNGWTEVNLWVPRIGFVKKTENGWVASSIKGKKDGFTTRKEATAYLVNICSKGH